MEVLVAILILAIGLLGLAALQARGLKYNHDAYARTQATYLAYEIIDLLRANEANAESYASDGPPAGVDKCEPGTSSPTMDLKCWYDAVAALLPAGAARIEFNDPQFDITIGWVERSARQPTADTCDDIPSREWDDDDKLCRVVQTWTVQL
jgi:type IV pilus assembly protein PilV